MVNAVLSSCFLQVKRMDIREAIIQEAEAVILRTGFYDLHYKEISEKTGVLPSEIHYLFPSKDDLGCTVIQRARISFKEWTKHIDHTIPDPKEKMDAYFASYRATLLAGDKICLGGILGAELNTLPTTMQTELRFYYMERQKWLEQVLYDGLYGGNFMFKEAVEEKALFILASIQGGLQIARINEDNDIFFTICRQLYNQLLYNQRADAVMLKS